MDLTREFIEKIEEMAGPKTIEAGERGVHKGKPISGTATKTSISADEEPDKHRGLSQKQY